MNLTRIVLESLFLLSLGVFALPSSAITVTQSAPTTPMPNGANGTQAAPSYNTTAPNPWAAPTTAPTPGPTPLPTPGATTGPTSTPTPNGGWGNSP